VTAARAALEHGVVPGGGGALLACAPALETPAADCDRADRGDEAAGVRALARTLAEPMRTIARNAGLESAPILAEARRRGPGWTFDVLRQEWVDPFDAGIVDPLAVVLTALETSASAVAATVTADVLIRRKRPPRATEP
jgi:chaperonin GroEL